jgi:hypothetical protein
MSATEAGSDSAAVSGKVKVSGSLNASESGSDTIAATGTVQAPGISGALVVTEGGRDTATFSGMVLLTALLNASETGSDTLTATGSVTDAAGPRAGTLAAVEGGSDAMCVGCCVIPMGLPELDRKKHFWGKPGPRMVRGR